MKNTLQKIIGIFRNPKLWASLIVIFGFATLSYAFSWPPSGCTPGSCPSPLSVDYVLQRIGIGVANPQAKLDVDGNIIASAPVANTHVTTKEYVDAAVWAAGDATADNQIAMMGSGFTTTTDSLTEIRAKMNTLPTSAGDATAANQTSIMGSGFSSVTNSLKAIRDKIDTLPTTSYGGVTWKGYTTSTYSGNMEGVKWVNGYCHAQYAWSHACTYDEIIKLGNNYPYTSEAWVIDGFDAYTGLNGGIPFSCITKDGYSIYNSYCFPNARGWTTSGYPGWYMATAGYMLIGSGDSRKLPCCQ